MDLESMVTRITQEVMEALKKGAPQAAPAKPPGAPDAKRAAVLAPEGIGSPARVALAQALQGGTPAAVFCGPKPVECCQSAARVRGDQTGDFGAALGAIDVIYYPVSRIHELSDIVELRDDRWEVRLVLRALELGKSVRVLRCLDETLPFVKAKVDELLRKAASYGVTCDACAPLAAPSFPGSPARPSACAAEKDECSGCGNCALLIPQKVGTVMESGADRVSSAGSGERINKELAAVIDHTLLKADAKKEEVIKLCEEAKKYQFASVCINPGFVKTAADCLRGTPVKVCTVIGFPLGATTSVTKAIETRDAIANGATEIDMVINVGALKAGSYDLVRDDIRSVVGAAGGNIVKVILETALLTDEEKVQACLLSKEAGADFVKTSTGFGPGGATAKDIALMRRTVGRYMGVKASGGIRDFKTAQEMINAGATRIGASASVAIVKEEKAEGKGY
jgi:deoxyribose-phosphate aldolase